MQQAPDKSQRPQTQTAQPCRRCNGTGTAIQVRDGKSVSSACMACRGTGKAGSGYPTK